MTFEVWVKGRETPIAATASRVDAEEVAQVEAEVRGETCYVTDTTGAVVYRQVKS